MYYLGIDVGSVSTDFVLLDKKYEIIEHLYLKTNGKPIDAIKGGLSLLGEKYNNKQISSVGITGSGRDIAGYIVGADIIKNEITAHAVAALQIDKDVGTIIEIGGQDSKIILIDNGIVVDFAMNTVCAAGTGSFLDRQAERMEIPIEEFGSFALKASLPTRIAGRCSVFAESDMIHKQGMGYDTADIIAGLCDALVRNYLTNVGKGKEIKDKIFFQGGVAANIGIKTAFERALDKTLYVPEHYHVMGAMGVGILSSEKKYTGTNFRGFSTAKSNFQSTSMECSECPNCCEVVSIMQDKDTLVGSFGDRCGKWSSGNIAAKF